MPVISCPLSVASEASAEGAGTCQGFLCIMSGSSRACRSGRDRGRGGSKWLRSDAHIPVVSGIVLAFLFSLGALLSAGPDVVTLVVQLAVDQQPRGPHRVPG